MLDVAACVQRLLAVHGIRRAAERLARRPLTSTDICRLSALAFLHDIGKANAGFQGKCWGVLGLPTPSGWPAPAGHVDEGWSLFSNSELGQTLLVNWPLEQMDQWGAATLSLLCAGMAHHGRPPVEIHNPTHLRRLWSPVNTPGNKPYHPSHTLNTIAISLMAWFPGAFAAAPELPQSPAFAHWFAGLVQLADWLGSDTRFFPYSAPGEDRQAHVSQRADRAVRAIGLDTNDWRKSLPQLPSFSTVFGVPAARPIQAMMSAPGLGPLLILESETGSGKTEAALWRFAHLFQTGEVDGLYFALPTRVAATQLYERVRTFAQALWSSDSPTPPVVVRALSGYASADGSEPVQLPKFKVLWPDNPDDRTAHLRWAAESNKRFLAATLAVGTVDQALLAALEVRHVHLRHCMLARSLLVVDEVHASDAYMSTLLTHLLRAHLAAGGHALLLSATLGSSARIRYQRLVHSNLPSPSLGQACAAPYPALSSGHKLHALANTGRNKKVHWHIKEAIDAPDQVATLALDAAQQGAKVLVIRNTVPAAVATLLALEVQATGRGLRHTLFQVRGINTLHHSRFSREDRPLLDAAAQAQLGKDRQEHPNACIVVGTQTLEQSLDIDADLLITDLCPMDVLLQRVGRLHRHDRPTHERPEPYRGAQAMVLVPAGQSLDPYLQRPRHGMGRFRQGGGVYADLRVLEATRHLITENPSHTIPQDNRMLVEHATHPDKLSELAQIKGALWIEHGTAVDGETLAGRAQANLNTLPFETPWVDDMGQVLTFADQDQHVGTRLGTNDYLLTFEPPQPGPFTTGVNKLPLRTHLWPQGLPPDTQPTELKALTDGGFQFNLGPHAFRYSRLGLERLGPTENTDVQTHEGDRS